MAVINSRAFRVQLIMFVGLCQLSPSNVTTLHGKQSMLTTLQKQLEQHGTIEKTVIYFLPFAIALLSLFDTNVLGDFLTGNPFVDDVNSAKNRALLRASFEEIHHMPLEQLSEIFNNLHEDINERADYIKDRADRSIIIHVLKSREERLLKSLHDLQASLLHASTHPTLPAYQRKLCAVVLGLGVLGVIYTTLASINLETKTWHAPSDAQYGENSAWLMQKLFGT